MDPRFYCDAMLGKLSRWLVFLGYDCKWSGIDGRADEQLLAEAQAEGRIFLTRDTKIPDVAGLRKLVLRPQHFEDQLAVVLETLGLQPDPKRRFTRCAYCNEAFEELTREEALPLVPPLVRELETRFFRCPKCRRVYWSGTHIEKAIKTLKGIPGINN